MKFEKKVLLLNNSGEWVFPKGHVEKCETEIQTAIRELAEESGIIVKEDNCLGLVDKFKFYFDGEKAVKVIKVYAFKVNDFYDIKFNSKEGFIDGQWVELQKAKKQLTHDDARKALNKSIIKLEK